MAEWNRRNGTGRTEEMLDSENQTRVEGLAGKISRLKGIALDIESETKHQNTYMDDHMVSLKKQRVLQEVNNNNGIQIGDFESSQGLLTGSMNRINHMVSAGKGNRKLMCYIILGLIILFFLSYYLISKVTSG